MTQIDRYFRLLALLTARLLTPLFPALPARLALKRSGQETVAGIEGPLTICRDRLGIPTIRAQTPSDLFFGFGYAITQDRLWQMDLYRRLAGGHLAEILGDRPLAVKPGAGLDPPPRSSNWTVCTGPWASLGRATPRRRSCLMRRGQPRNAMLPA